MNTCFKYEVWKTVRKTSYSKTFLPQNYTHFSNPYLTRFRSQTFDLCSALTLRGPGVWRPQTSHMSSKIGRYTKVLGLKMFGSFVVFFETTSSLLRLVRLCFLVDDSWLRDNLHATSKCFLGGGRCLRYFEKMKCLCVNHLLLFSCHDQIHFAVLCCTKGNFGSKYCDAMTFLQQGSDGPSLKWGTHTLCHPPRNLDSGGPPLQQAYLWAAVPKAFGWATELAKRALLCFFASAQSLVWLWSRHKKQPEEHSNIKSARAMET